MTLGKKISYDGCVAHLAYAWARASYCAALELTTIPDRRTPNRAFHRLAGSARTACGHLAQAKEVDDVRP